MKTIKETIVVEGKNDTARVKQFFSCQTIETGGSELKEEVLERIARAKDQNGVIIFTDPDTPGNRIRQVINDRIPGCKNAFVQKKEARTEKKVGVEHASYAALAEALSHLVTYEEKRTALTMQDMAELGLTGAPSSREKRELAAKVFHLGEANAKRFLERANYAGITKKEMEEVLNGQANCHKAEDN